MNTVTLYAIKNFLESEGLELLKAQPFGNKKKINISEEQRKKIKDTLLTDLGKERNFTRKIIIFLMIIIAFLFIGSFCILFYTEDLKIVITVLFGSNSAGMIGLKFLHKIWKDKNTTDLVFWLSEDAPHEVLLEMLQLLYFKEDSKK